MCLFAFSDLLLFLLLILSVLLPFTNFSVPSVLRLFYFFVGLFLVCLNVVFFVIGTLIVKCFFQHQRIIRDLCFFVGGILLLLLIYFLPIWIWE